MSQLNISPEVVDERTLSKAHACLREAGVALPTLSQLADPETIPPERLAALAQVDPGQPHPANLWRVHWFNDAAGSTPGWVAVGTSELFFAAPRSVAEPGQPGAVLGLLNLDPAHFGLAQVDVDGAMHKTIMLAETLLPSGDHTRVPNATPQAAQHPEVFDPEATLPSLRSGGMSLYADHRALQLLQ